MVVQLEYISHLLQIFLIMLALCLNAFSDLLCLKLCWHNRLVPNRYCLSFSEVAFSTERYALEKSQIS